MRAAGKSSVTGVAKVLAGLVMVTKRWCGLRTSLVKTWKERQYAPPNLRGLYLLGKHATPKIPSLV